MKITMVGISGSGKTAYMSALYDALGDEGKSDTGFYIVPRPKKIDLSETALIIGDFSRLSIGETEQFPESTTQTTLWSFDVMYRGNPVTYFDWIDYRGGVLLDIFDQKTQDAPEVKEEIDQLLSHIIASNAVILIADAFSLTHYTNPKVAMKQSGTNKINNLFRAFDQVYPERDLIFIIMLTQADTIAPKWKENDYKLLIDRGLEAFYPIVQLCKRNPPWVGGIVPVSAVGEGKVERTIIREGSFKVTAETKDEIIDYPEPMNVEHALFYCLAQTLQQMKELGEERLRQHEVELAKALRKQGVANKIWSIITGKPSAEEIAVELSRERQKDIEGLQQFERYIHPLFAKAMQRVRPL